LRILSFGIWFLFRHDCFILNSIKSPFKFKF
jgi:hypothetical protein